MANERVHPRAPPFVDPPGYARHRLVIESLPRGAETPDLSLPVCLAGENACPPEDVGGPGGYELFLEILADRALDVEGPEDQRA